MKKLVLIIALAVTPIITFGQGLFDKYEDLDDVTSVVVNSKMFSMISQIEINTDDADAQAFVDMVKSLKSLKVLTTGDAGVSANMKSDVNKY